MENVGGFAAFWKAFPGPRGRPDLKTNPKNSSQTAFGYPEQVGAAGLLSMCRGRLKGCPGSTPDLTPKPSMLGEIGCCTEGAFGNKSNKSLVALKIKMKS